MQREIVGGVLYLLWLLSPAIVLFGLRALRLPAEIVARSTVAAAVFAIPGYLGLTCLVTGVAWPPDIFFPARSPLTASVPGYRVEYSQEWGQDFYETYYKVTRADGLRAYLEIDPDDSKCWSLSTQRVGSKIYFLCDEKTPTEHSPYLDTAHLVVYTGDGYQCERPLDKMVYRDYKTNPLADRNVIMTQELYRSVSCQPQDAPADF
jgi:hypothetical protein